MNEFTWRCDLRSGPPPNHCVEGLATQIREKSILNPSTAMGNSLVETIRFVLFSASDKCC